MSLFDAWSVFCILQTKICLLHLTLGDFSNLPKAIILPVKILPFVKIIAFFPDNVTVIFHCFFHQKQRDQAHKAWNRSFTSKCVNSEFLKPRFNGALKKSRISAVKILDLKSLPSIKQGFWRLQLLFRILRSALIAN